MVMNEQNEYTSKFIKILTHIELSRTQAIRVGLVDTNPADSNSKLVVAIQKFWRKGDEDWRPGKGFHLDFETSQMVCDSLEQAITIMDKTPETKPNKGWLELVQSLS